MTHGGIRAIDFPADEALTVPPALAAGPTDAERGDGPRAETRRPGRTLRQQIARAIASGRRRSLIGDILVAQLAIAAAIGLAAVIGLWWASDSMIRDDMRAWGSQWLDNLDRLGAPLETAAAGRRYPDAEAYVRDFAEVLFVRYYSAAGVPVFTESGQRGSAPPPLEARRLAETAGVQPGERHYVLDASGGESPIVRIAKPVRSQPADTLLGYVELGLDFSSHQTSLLRSVLAAALIGTALLLLATAASWLTFRRALRPLSALQIPLRRLARGRTDVSVAATGHREIVAIANAMNTTANAIGERDRELTRMAQGDAVTGLINRRRFSELLEHEVAQTAEAGRTSALLLVDLDQFKYVNDTFGHAVGDTLLKLVAERLREVVGPRDVVARFGGDEFVVLLPDIGRKDAAALCGRLIASVRDLPFVVDDQPFDVRCSIGVAMIRGSREPASLLSQADMACHHAKASGRDQVRFYRTSDKEVTEIAADAAWFLKIRTALKNDAFVLHYQPIVNVRTRQTTYYEVLLRMLADGDMVSPGSFMPAATRVGLMAEIDQWVIRHALRSLAALRAERGDVRFTLNVSGNTFEQPGFFAYLQGHLRDTGVPLDAVVIEITEQVAMRNLDTAAAQMAALVDRGCRFAIDDFGCGYGSYSYLKKLPVAFVKIDGSFIVNLAADKVDRTIVGAINDVAAATHCETIAEHVENDATLRLLGRLGVTYAQGYLLGKPAPGIDGAERAAIGAARSPRAKAASARRRAAC